MVYIEELSRKPKHPSRYITSVPMFICTMLYLMKWDSATPLKRYFDGIILKDFKNEISNEGRELDVTDNVVTVFLSCYQDF